MSTDEQLTEDDEFDAVTADVQAALERLAAMEIDAADPEDIDRLRQSLPTEPTRARLLKASLPPALDHAIEYVAPSDRQSGYWRRAPPRSNPAELSDAELKHRLAFVRAARDQRGREGTTRTADGRRIARSADGLAEQLEGTTFATDDVDAERGQGIIDRIRSFIRR